MRSSDCPSQYHEYKALFDWMADRLGKKKFDLLLRESIENHKVDALLSRHSERRTMRVL